ncbi:MAG: hypothetical protein Q7J35_02065 [Candidatus Methanoperedens sp.]|nr:hypothetical protein [Candidatus Methanoperedens sp.]
MIELIWDEKFRRIFKKWCQKHPDLKEEKNKILLIDIGTRRDVY